MSEAILLAFISVVFALGIVLLAFRRFNQLTGKDIVFPYASGSFWLSLLALAIITGLVSGSYPAFFLSGFQPIRVLKGTLRFSPATAWFRQGLVVFQFVLVDRADHWNDRRFRTGRLCSIGQPGI